MEETRPLLRPLEDAVTAQQPHTAEYEDTLLAFNPQGDTDNPRDWPASYQWGITALLAFMAFTVTFTCLSVIPVAGHVIADLSPTHQPSRSATVLLVTIWELGEAAGPLLIAPLSELYGRAPVFNCANTLFILGVALSALSPTTGALISARFLTGCAVASNVLNPAVIGDIFPPESRGSAMSAVMLAPLIGGAVGPAIAGAIAQSAGWRQIMWMSVLLAVIAEFLFLTLFRETYSGAILRRRATRLQQEKRGELDEPLESACERVLSQKPGSQSAVIWQAMQRPAKVFRSSLVLQLLSLYGAVAFSFFYTMSTTLPEMLQTQYGFSPALIGSSFLTFSESPPPPS
ncbi:hypothetical protein LTR08_005207 [Meristemomyces frigidus]|nr:hypothetical protein LTR08_005207 [Meristemomyces frigidus]